MQKEEVFKKHSKNLSVQQYTDTYFRKIDLKLSRLLSIFISIVYSTFSSDSMSRTSQTYSHRLIVLTSYF